MGEATKIQWCDATFNPWRGCQKVSLGCAHCYAETMSKRNPKVLGEWGPNGTRVVASEAKWREPLKWDREAAAAGVRRKVFCASLADVFEDRPDVRGSRFRLFQLIQNTQHLDWLLLTKRPQNVEAEIRRYVNFLSKFVNGFEQAASMDWANRWLDGEPPANVWLGVSCEDQATADERIPILLQVRAAVRFISAEPLLGPIDLGGLLVARDADPPWSAGPHARIAWVITGGESGHGARPMDVAWVRSIIRKCRALDVPCFVKQLGARPFHVGIEGKLRDPKGGSMDEWPECLRVRQFPEPARA